MLPLAMKRALIIIGIVVAVLVIIVIALPLLFDADSFRPRIESELRTALAREVKIGHLSLSLMAGGVTAENISIADDPAFSANPFLHAKSLDVGLDLPALLFSRALNIHSITIVEPEVALVHSNAQWNFSSLGATRESPAKPAAAGPGFSVQKLRVVHGRISVAAVGKAPTTYDDLTLDAGNISYTSPIPFTIEANTPGGGKLKIDGHAGPIDRADAARTPLQTSVVITGMDLAKTGLLPADSGVAGLLDFTGTLSSDGKTLHSEGAVKTQQLRLVKTGSPARQPVSLSYISDYDLKRQVGSLARGEVRTGNCVAHVSGNYDARGQDAVVHLKLNGQNLPITDLAGLLPALGVALPAGSSLQAGAVTANLALDGALDKLVTTGTLDAANLKLANFNLGSKMSAIALLAGLRTGSDTTIQTMTSRLRIAPEGMRADSLSILIPELGAITGAGTLSNTNALNFRMAAKLNNNASLVGGLQRVTGLGQANKPIPFLIQGTTQNPVFLPDVGGFIGNTVPVPAQGMQQGIGGILGIFQKKKKQ
ncbi:MAG: AsmA family protein [Acidobacteriia bacterium]|nr:AsmA family protein [Terriglobia bacterium]